MWHYPFISPYAFMLRWLVKKRNIFTSTALNHEPVQDPAVPSGSILPLISARTMDRTWGQDGGGSGCKRLFCCCGAAAKLVRCLPVVQPAPLRQDAPLIAAKLGSPVLEPNLQENLLVTVTLTTAPLLFSASKGAAGTSVHRRSELRPPPTRNTQTHIQVKPDTFRSVLAAFAKLRKATISFFMSVRPSVCVPMEQLGSHWTGFHEI